MSSNLTTEEFADSMTGFEELAIPKKFGKEITDLPGTMSLRAMVFTDLARSGQSADTAYSNAMEMSVKHLGGYFAEDDEITPDAPATDSGKDDSLDDEVQTI